MGKQRERWCGECRRVDPDAKWCDVCATFVCEDCGETHDCTEHMLEDDEEEADPAWGVLFKGATVEAPDED